MRGCKKAASRFWDGSVIGVVSNNHVVNPSVYKNIPFDSLADITPITIIGATPFVLVAHPSVPAKNVQELIAYAKSKPGVLNYGSSGNGTILHLGAAMFVDQAKLAIQHIPYKGMGPLMNDVLSGQVQLAVVAVAPAGLPKTELARLYNAFKAAMEMPEARDALVAQGYEIKLTPPDAAAAFFRSEAARMAQVVKNANVKLD